MSMLSDRRVIPARRAALCVLVPVAIILLAIMLAGCGSGQIQAETNMGTYMLTKVESVQTFQGQQAGPGQTLLVITIGRPPMGRGLISDDVQYLSEETDDVVIGPDGKRYPRAAWKLNEDSTAALGYKVPANQEGFKMAWGDKEPVEVGK
jgi:hypothetical protein